MRTNTVCLIKPDAIADGHLGHIIVDIESSGLVVADLALGRWPSGVAEQFYAEHRGAPFFHDLTTFMSGGRLAFLTLVSLDEEVDAVALWRSRMGSTDPAKAAEGTLRNKYGRKNGIIMHNAVHGSADRDAVAREIAIIRDNVVRDFGTQAMRFLANRE